MKDFYSLPVRTLLFFGLGAVAALFAVGIVHLGIEATVIGVAFVGLVTLWFAIKNKRRVLFLALILCIPLEISKTFHPEGTPIHYGGAQTYPTVYLLDFLLFGLLFFTVFDHRETNTDSTRKVTIRTVKRDWPIYVWFFFSFLSIINAPSWNLVVLELWQMIKKYIFFLLLVYYLDSYGRIRWAVNVTLWALVAESFLGYFQYFSQIPLEISGLGLTSQAVEPWGPAGAFIRASGTFGGANPMGGYFDLLLPIVFALMFTDERNRRWRFVQFIICFVALILTFSRASWSALALSLPSVLFIFLIVHPTRSRVAQVSRLAIVALFIGTLAIIPFWKVVVNRFTTVTSVGYSVVEERVNLNKSALNMIKAHPIIGVGLNNFTEVLPNYQVQENYWIAPVHNYPLLVMSETGLFAFLAFGLVVVRILRTAFRNVRFLRSGFLVLVNIGIIAGYIGFGWHAMFDHIFRGSTNSLLFWFLAAVVVSTARLRHRTVDPRMSTLER